MYRCPVCQACYPDTWQQPIRCQHQFPGRDFTKPRQPASREPVAKCSVNPWLVIHDRWGAAIGQPWDKHLERDWYQTQFLPLVPRDSATSCGCESDWKKLTTSRPIDFSTAEKAFASIWDLHNQVNVKLGKPEISYAEAESLYVQQPKLDIVAVTSLNPSRHERQIECLRSWKRFGLSIVVTQPEREIEAISGFYPMVDEWRACEGNQPPTIRQIVDVGRDCLLINADVEIRGNQAGIDWNRSGIVGIRWNYEKHWHKSTREQWGIDVFSFTPAQVKALPDLPFRIGKPWWDYWLAEITKDDGRKWLLEPLFFHQTHEIGWTDKDWQTGAELFKSQFGRTYDRGNVREFRSQFPG